MIKTFSVNMINEKPELVGGIHYDDSEDCDFISVGGVMAKVNRVKTVGAIGAFIAVDKVDFVCRYYACTHNIQASVGAELVVCTQCKQVNYITWAERDNADWE